MDNKVEHKDIYIKSDTLPIAYKSNWARILNVCMYAYDSSTLGDIPQPCYLIICFDGTYDYLPVYDLQANYEFSSNGWAKEYTVDIPQYVPDYTK